MARLRQRDLATLSRAMALLYADTDAASLSKRILASLNEAFSCDFASFSLMDLRLGSWHASALSPYVPSWPGTEIYQRHLRNDPAASYIMRTHDPRAVRISDFVSLRQYRDLSVYTEVFGRVGCDRRLGFAIQGGSPVSLAVTVNRKGRDFSDEDRRLLDLLRPHLFQANAQAQASRRADAERARERANIGEVLGVGLGEIDAAGRLLWLTARGESLLKEFFPVRGHHPSSEHLPDELLKQLAPVLRPVAVRPSGEPPGLTPLVWQFVGAGERRLKVRLAAGAAVGQWQIFLEAAGADAASQATADILKLTSREKQILYWIGQGKSNWDIGRILSISDKTVGKHLERVFAKLKVENRTAAARVAAEARVGL